MAVLNVVDVTIDGSTTSYAPADAAGDQVPNDGKTVVRVKNGGGAQITVTIKAQRQCDQGFLHDLEVDIPAGTEKAIGPFPTGRFNKSDGRVEIEYSAVAAVTVEAETI